MTLRIILVLLAVVLAAVAYNSITQEERINDLERETKSDRILLELIEERFAKTLYTD